MERKETEIERLEYYIKGLARLTMRAEFRICEEYEKNFDEDLFGMYKKVSYAAKNLEAVGKRLSIKANNARVKRMIIEELKKEGEI